jgi:8-oxo-dGTP pyrophosphatase MutT (NUDIX family)
MRKEEKHKAIAIPVSYSDSQNPKFLTVKDRRFKEWVFVTGGCRKREIVNPLRCALRELEEETRGVVNIKHGTYSYFNFSLEDVHMTLIYHVYILDVDIPTSEQLQLVKRFYEQKAIVDKRKVEGLPVKRVYDENDMMNFETLGEFINRERVWPLIRNNILNNPEFYSALSSTNRKTFNMCTSK